MDIIYIEQHGVYVIASNAMYTNTRDNAKKGKGFRLYEDVTIDKKFLLKVLK